MDDPEGDYNWNTDDEDEVFGMPSSVPIIINSSNQESCGHNVVDNTFNFERDKILTVLVNMEYTVEEALMAMKKCGPEAEICELTGFICAAQLEKEIDSHLQDLPKKKHDVPVYAHKKTLEDPSPDASRRPYSANKIEKQLDISNDEDSYPGSEENNFNFERDQILTVLVNMEYTVEEALMAIEKCGACSVLLAFLEAEICELTDFICAAQLEKEIDSHLQDLPKKYNAPVYTHTKRRDDYYFNIEKRLKLDNEKWKSEMCSASERKPSAIDMEMIHMQSFDSMTGFCIPNQLYPMVSRKLPHKVAAGQLYFYYENVAIAPKGVWRKISSFLFDIDPEFVDSKFFCAAARKRGYIHNLPIENRSPLLPMPPLTIQEALPTTKRWWPSWDKRTQLNCLVTSIAAATVTKKIMNLLEEYDAKPPSNVQEYILKECRNWNLVWVGKNKVAPLEPDEYEMLLGFPKDHTRGGGISRTVRYRALGNAFQVDTVAYHLSVLKGRFPNGINVLSLFSGIGGAEVALHRLGIMLRNVVSVEVAEENRNILRCWWEQTNQKGNLIEFEDIQQVTSDKLEQWIASYGGFDLVIGGSPCNNLTGSNRVSRNGLEGEHSSLFYDYYRIVQAIVDIQQ